MPPTPINRNLGNSIHPGLDETDLPKTWIASNDYFHHLAISVPVSEDYTLLQADTPSRSRFIQPHAAQNDIICAVPPNWTSQTQTLWHQDPEDWTQLNHNVGILDTPGRTKTPSSHRMENGAVNPYPAYLDITVFEDQMELSLTTSEIKQCEQMTSQPRSHRQVDPVDEIRDFTNGRHAYPSSQGSKPQYVCPKLKV